MRVISSPFQVIEYQEGVILKRGLRKMVVSGNGALEKVLLILTYTSGQSATIQEICESFAVPDRQGIEKLIHELLQKRFLKPLETDESDFGETETDIFYEEFGLQQQKIIDDLSQANLLLVGVNFLSHSIYMNLAQQGIENVEILDDPILRSEWYIDEDGNWEQEVDEDLISQTIDASSFQQKMKNNPPQCLIACSDFGGQALLQKWNRFCIQNQIDFLPVYLQDMLGYLGPLVIPGETACLACLRQRQNAHLRDIELRNLIETHATEGQSIVASHPSAIGVLAHTAVFELMHFYGKMPGPRPGRLTRVNLLEGFTESKQVLKVPRCPVCSKLNRTAEIQINKMNPLQ